MSLTTQEIGECVSELAPLLAGRSLRRILQLDAHTMALRLGQQSLVISGHPRASRLFVMPARELKNERRQVAGNFCRLLRRRLGRDALLAIHQAPGDRLVRLTFGERSDHAEGGFRSTLVAELFGARSNLILLDASDRIIGCLRKSRFRTRDLRPGQPYPEAPPPPASKPIPSRFGQDPDGPSARIRAYYAPLVTQWRCEELQRQLGRELKRELKRKSQLIQRLQRDRSHHELSLDLQHFGDLILAHPLEIKAKQSSVVVPDLFSNDPAHPPITIPLDPRLDGAQNANRYYRRAQKARRGIRAIDERLPWAESEQARIQQALDRLAQLSLSELEKLAGPAVDPAGSQKEIRQPYHRFVSSDDTVILVGRSAKDNDALTFRVARGRDLWFHVRDYTGSHVVLRLHSSAEPPQQAVRDAARLAKHFSRARHSDQADVHWTERKHVRRAKNPGQVYLAQTRTIRIRDNPKRIKWLFDQSSVSQALIREIDRVTMDNEPPSGRGPGRRRGH